MRKSTLLRLLPALLAATSLAACFTVPQQAYYVSPLNGNAEDYHPQPLLCDSSTTGFYVRSAWFGGSANDLGNDRLSGWNLSVYAAHHAGHIQFFGGLDLSLGNYNVGKWDTSYQFPSILNLVQWAPPGQSQNLRPFAGPKFFGSTGISGGVDFAVPFRSGGEWRVIGLETSLQREFGDYLSFRRQLPDSLVTLVVRNRLFGTLGASTEIIGRLGPEGEWGIRWAMGGVLGPDYNHLHIYDNVSQQPLVYKYVDLSLHFSYSHFTLYFQLNSATKASTGHIGLVYRMGNPRLPGRAQRPYRVERMENSLIMP